MATGGTDTAEEKAFQENSAVLFDAIANPEALAWKLFSKGIISKETRSRATQPTSTREEKMTVLLGAMEAQFSVNPKRFYDLLDVLSGDRSTAQVKEELSAAVRRHAGCTSVLLANLQEDLDKLKSLSMDDDDDEHTTALIKKVVDTFLKRSFETRAPLEEVKRDLSILSTTHLLLTESELNWSMSRLEELAVSASPSCTKVVDSSKVLTVRDLKPLFNKEVVYHASLCCVVVNSSSGKNLLVSDHNRHLLEEVSITRSKEGQVDRYLIARQGKTYYVAFKGELNLDNWRKHFKSFEEGVTVQSARIPLRFFIEQLNNGYRIVLTGFSFGGLLACSVTARLFQQPYLTSEQLFGSLVCITFGQPLISLHAVEETAHMLPALKSVLHCVFAEDDVFSQLMRYTEVKVSTVTDDTAVQQLQDPFSSKIFQQLAELQNHTQQNKKSTSKGTSSHIEYADSLLTDVKAHLKQASSEFSDEFNLPIPVAENVYRISNERLEWKKLTNTDIPKELGLLSSAAIEKLPVDFNMNHVVMSYHQKITKGYLECPPSYNLPPPSTTAVKEVPLLKPSVESVAFHRHGKELAVVVEGDNLWFCHGVEVGSLKTVETEAENTSRRSIQFNYTPESEGDFHTEETVRVKLLSQFSNPIGRPAVQVIKKVYEFTFRQEQLAKLTPSELIELAYMSALLEQHPFSKFQPQSNRFRVLKKFLEEIGSVVPLESVLYAIASGDPEVAVVCCNMLQASKIQIPLSACTLAGSGRALIRMKHDEVIPLVTTGLFWREVDVACDYERMGLLEKVDPHTADKMAKVSSMVRDDRMNAFPTSKSEVHKALKKMYTKEDKHFPKTTGRMPVPTTYKQRGLDVTYVQSYDVAVSEAGSRLLLVSSGADISSETPQVHFLARMRQEILQKSRQQQGVSVICGLNIELLYPITKRSFASDCLKSPLDILSTGREKLARLSNLTLTRRGKAPKQDIPKSLSEQYNSQMLQVINDIRQGDLHLCTTLLGAFMEEQMQVPLKETSHTTAKAIASVIASAAVGVWFLFSLALPDVNRLLASIPNYELLVQVKDYIKGIFRGNTVTTERMYAAAVHGPRSG